MAIIQCRPFDGTAREEAIWWTLRHRTAKGEAVCRIFTHPIGHELRLDVLGRLEDSQVCHTDEEVLSWQERRRAALEVKGWG